MKKYIYAIVMLIMTVSCNDMEVGYLDTASAAYHPGRMEIRKEPNMSDWLDLSRFSAKAHWVSPAIQGVLGTPPIFMTIDKIRTENGGNVDVLMKHIVLRGNGQFDVDFDNDVPLGRYIITLKVENEGRSAILEDIFIIDFKQK